jgi:hypothetical protein
MGDLRSPNARKCACELAKEKVEKLLGIIHKLFTRVLLIRPERVERKIRVGWVQGK